MPINANAGVRVDIKLELGQVTNTVTVKSTTLQAETQSTQMGDVIQSSKITSVPLNGRSFIDLLAPQPGVSSYQTDSAQRQRLPNKTSPMEIQESCPPAFVCSL